MDRYRTKEANLGPVRFRRLKKFVLLHIVPQPRKDGQSGSKPACTQQSLSPILRAMIDVQDFDGVWFDRINHNVGER
jgi:hypothetical protein